MIKTAAKLRPTVRTIAASLDISAITVSRALNGHPLVSAETRKKVLNMVKEVGYDFKEHSATVRNECRQNVAIHCGDDKLYSDNFLNFYMNLHYLCMRRLKAEKFRGQLVDFNQHRDNAFQILDNCASLIVLGPIDPAVFAQIRHDYPKLKIVSVFGNVAGVTEIGPDDFAGGATAARVLFEHGHRRTMIFSCLNEASFRKRCGGFTSEMRALAPASTVDLVEITEQHEQAVDDQLKEQALDRYFNTVKERPSACFVPNGYAGIFLANYLTRHHISVPADMSLITYDNLEIFQYNSPELARVWFDIKKLAAQAVEILKFALQHNKNQCLGITIENEFTPGGSICRVR